MLHICGRRVSQSRRKRSCRKVVTKLPQSCHRVVAEFVAEFVAKFVAKCVARFAQVYVNLFQNPLGEHPFSVLPI